MTVGGSIFVIAVGAILRYAINDEIEGVDLQTIGLILMIAGAAGLVLGLFMYLQDRGRAEPYERPPERDRPPPRY